MDVVVVVGVDVALAVAVELQNSKSLWQNGSNFQITGALIRVLFRFSVRCQSVVTKLYRFSFLRGHTWTFTKSPALEWQKNRDYKKYVVFHVSHLSG